MEQRGEESREERRANQSKALLWGEAQERGGLRGHVLGTRKSWVLEEEGKKRGKEEKVWKRIFHSFFFFFKKMFFFYLKSRESLLHLFSWNVQRRQRGKVAAPSLNGVFFKKNFFLLLLHGHVVVISITYREEGGGWGKKRGAEESLLSSSLERERERERDKMSLCATHTQKLNLFSILTCIKSTLSFQEHFYGTFLHFKLAFLLAASHDYIHAKALSFLNISPWAARREDERRRKRRRRRRRRRRKRKRAFFLDM